MDQPTGAYQHHLELRFQLLRKGPTDLSIQEIKHLAATHHLPIYPDLGTPWGQLEEWLRDHPELRDRIQLPTRGGTLPTRSLETDAGIDIYASERMVIPAQGFAQVRTGIAWQPPPGWYAQIQARSGMSSKHGIIYLGGVIDANYRGEWRITLGNLGNRDYQVEPGHKIVQAVLHPVPTVTITQVEQLDDTDRGTQGFGSSGV